MNTTTASVSEEYFQCYRWRQSLKRSSPSDICGYQTGIKAWYDHSRRWAFQQIRHSWLSDPLMNLFHLYSFPPPDLNSGIKSRLSVCPLSKYNYPMHSVTGTCQKCGMSQKQRAQRHVEESQRDMKRREQTETGRKKWEEICIHDKWHHRWERKKRAVSEERREQSHVWNKWEEMYHQDSSKQKKLWNYITDLEKTA